MSEPFEDDGKPAQERVGQQVLQPGYRGNPLANRQPAQSYVERLHQRRHELKGEVEQLDEAIAALEKHPEIEKVIHAITRVQGLY